MAQYQEFDFSLKKLVIEANSGKEMDISELYEDINIYESINMNHINGEITIKDTNNLYEVIKLKGGEKLKIEVDIPGNEKLGKLEKEFIIYKMDSVIPDDKTQTKTYTLYFVTEPAIKNEQSRVRQSFNTCNAGIVEKVSTNLLEIENLEVERCKYTEQGFVVPNWKPFFLFNFLASNSISNSNDATDYVFYEDMEKFNFKTLSQLKRQDKKYTFAYTPGNNSSSEFDINKIIQYNVDNNWDHLDIATKGGYGSKLYHYNLITKEFKEQIFNYNEEKDSWFHLNKEPFENTLEFNENSHIGFSSNNYFYEHSDEWRQLSPAQKLQNKKTVMTIVMPGSPERKPGNVALIIVPSTKTEKTVNLDSMLSGNFLIANIRHYFAPGEYRQIIRVEKDSKIKELEK